MWFDKKYPFSEGIFLLKSNGLYGFCDEKCERLTPVQYREKPRKSGHFVICEGNAKNLCDVYTESLEKICECRSCRIYGDWLVAWDGSQYAIYGKEGHLESDFYDAVAHCGENEFVVQKNGMRNLFLDLKTVFETGFDRLENVGKSLYVAEDFDKGIFLVQNQKVLEPCFDAVGFSHACFNGKEYSQWAAGHSDCKIARNLKFLAKQFGLPVFFRRPDSFFVFKDGTFKEIEISFKEKA